MATTSKPAGKTDDILNDVADTASKVETLTTAPMREIAEKSVQQAKEGYARLRSVAEETTDAMEDTYATASKGYKELGRKSVEVTRSNINAHFDFLNALLGAKSISQAVELQTAYARQQSEIVGAQLKELTALAQKAATDGSKPFQTLATKGLRSAQAR